MRCNCSPVWVTNGGRIPWKVIVDCDTFKVFMPDWKTPYERRLGMSGDGPVKPFVAMVEYHPISAKDQSRLHQI